MHKTALLALALLACGDDASSPGATESDDFTCSLGSLTGTWRVTYSEQDGSCGPVPAETVSYKGGAGGLDPSCTYTVNKVSADKCRMDFDFTCPTTDGEGTQRWTGVTRQTAEDRLTGDASAQVDHPAGTCRSTYTMSWSRL